MRDAAGVASIDTGTAGRIRTHLEKEHEEMISFVEELAGAESPSTDPGSQDTVFELVRAPLEGIGYRVRRFAGRSSGGQLLAYPADRRHGGPFQLLLGHVDTVWGHGTLDTMPLRRDGGKLCGPGVFDMKAGIAQAVFALRALDALRLDPSVTPVLFLTSDEEIGSDDSKERIRHLARGASRALVLEPALGEEGRIKTERKGTGHFSVRIFGKSSHAGLAPREGASAIEELAVVIRKLHALTDHERGVTVNVGVVEGGVRANVVAAGARAEVDVRVRTIADGARLEDSIRAIEAETPGTRVEIEGAIGRPPLEPTPRNQRLWRAAQRVGRAMGLDLESAAAGGASDGNFTSLHTATLDGLGPVGDGAHAAHEFVWIDRVPERAALLAGLLLLPPGITEPAATADEPADEAPGG